MSSYDLIQCVFNLGHVMISFFFLMGRNLNQNFQKIENAFPFYSIYLLEVVIQSCATTVQV